MGRKLGRPVLPDLATLIAAGINPKNGLPTRLTSFSPQDCELKTNAKRLFRIVDEQRAVGRYTWYNLPAGLSSQELERIIYYRYSLCFFYYKDLGQFFFMPYALDGGLDFYQRYVRIHPVPMAQGQPNEEKKPEYKTQLQILQNIKLNVVRDVVVDASELTEEKLTTSAVILRDYTNQLAQLSEPRYSLNDHLLDMEADCLPFLRTNLIANAGIQGLRVPDADCASEVDAVSKQLYSSALKGNPYVAITAPVDLQELQPKSNAKANEYLLALQSIDNLLLSTYGITNNGVYEKKAHILESENQVNATNVDLVLADGLRQRQTFCNIVNSVWNLNIWCEISEELLGYDKNGDGVSYEESTDGEGSGYSTEEQGGDE